MALTKRTILQILQDAATELRIPVPTAIVGSSDFQVNHLLQLAHRVGNDLQARYEWPQLQKEHTVTIVASQANYAFPSDMDYTIFRTHWDRSNQWELIGPLSPQEWQWFKSGIVSSFPRRRFRIKGYADKQFFVDPTPVASEAGETLVFEYQSQTWIRPITYATGLVFAAGAYTFEDGVIYSTALGGTSSGATVAADVGVTDWATFSDEYNRFLADTDVPLLDEELLNLGVQWRFKQSNGLDWQVARADFEALMAKETTAIKSSPTLHLSARANPRFISSINVPDTDFGS